MLRVGSTGSEVEELQQFLIDQGYDLGSAGADGIFGSKTRAAVRQFQSDQGITIDGVVGPVTQGKIDTFGVADEAEDEGEPAPEEPDLLEDDDVIAPEGAVEGDEAGAASIPGVMSGGTIHRVDNPEGQQDFYVIEYEYPPGSGHSFYYRFDSIEALEAAVGPNLGGGEIAVGEVIPEGDLGTWTDAGDANEIVGVEGSFQGFVEDVIADATAAAGGSDPTLVGAALQDPAIALILAQSAEGDWSDERVLAAMRNTDYYKDVIYPGIENFYGQTSNPEAQYAMYKQNVEQTLKRMGVPTDPDGTYKTSLAGLLDAGVSDTALQTFAPAYTQAQTNVGFADALSAWTQRFAGVTIESFEDYFDVLAGNAPAEIQEIAEMAGLQFMAENAGFEISTQQIEALAGQTNLSQDDAGRLFSATAKDLLALGERGLRRGNLTAEQVLDAEAGIGGNVEQIKLRMQKLAREEGLSDHPTASIFTDFNREGAPIKKGLQSTISEGA